MIFPPLMKRLLILPILALSLALGPSRASAEDGKLPVTLSASPEGKPTKQFDADTAKIYLAWQGKGILKPGDKLRTVWIAVDTIGAAPDNYKIDEWSGTVATAGANGYSSVSKPTAGWPPGKYRVELYVGDDLAAPRRFVIGRLPSGTAKDEDDD